ncbi:MAG: polyamine aminopropyltransferase [Sporomusaceae bacterium]|nr:polyamine aminopropyltransferase [Sporomusaceae bacterium]
MELWCTELQTPNLTMSARIKETLYTGRSEFQEIVVVDTDQFGKMLVLDGVFQTSTAEEFVYHEMIAHVPLFTHPDPKRVLVIGGGDGGTVREVLKHKSVTEVKMVEIDGLVVEACKKYLPEHSVILRDAANQPRFELLIGDGIKYMQKSYSYYDIIIVDCSDPIGPGEGLFNHAFYQDVLKALKPDGIFVQQTESPFYHQELIQRVYKDVSSLFPVTRLYLANIPLYPGGLHSFTMGSRQYDPQNTPPERINADFSCRYYNREIHHSAFALPNFARDLLTNTQPKQAANP